MLSCVLDRLAGYVQGDASMGVDLVCVYMHMGVLRATLQVTAIDIVGLELMGVMVSYHDRSVLDGT